MFSFSADRLHIFSIQLSFFFNDPQSLFINHEFSVFPIGIDMEAPSQPGRKKLGRWNERGRAI